jgi:hypothetical protein
LVQKMMTDGNAGHGTTALAGATVADVWDATAVAGVRKGSPFAPGTAKPMGHVATGRWMTGGAATGRTMLGRRLVSDQESIGEGVWRETAASAAFASLMLIAFGVGGWFYFPAGGVAIATLGLAMSLLALSSRHTKLAGISLIAHTIALVACYFKTM